MNCIYMLFEFYDNYGCDFRLVWICNCCLFLNFFIFFLLNVFFLVIVFNSFGSVFSFLL